MSTRIFEVPSAPPGDAGEGRKKRHRSLRTPADLASAGLIPPNRIAEIERVVAEFALAVTTEMAELIDPADPRDPIAAQFIPNLAELSADRDELADPIGDLSHSPLKGIVHRYPDRVLLKPVHVCPVYCRFCFRREVVGPGSDALTGPELTAAIDYIRERPEIWEVIVTGGDPFMMAPRRIKEIVAALDAIPHLGVIRFHSRVPVVDPSRVTPELAEALTAEKAVFVALHANHPRELTPAMRDACRHLSQAGIPLLSQTVLLKGVNDDAAVLTRLMRGLVSMRVKPYYLHHGDLARGTAHFRTSIEAGQAILREMRGHVSGLCQPSYVLDLPGGHGKAPIGPSFLSPAGDGRWRVEDFRGVKRDYPREG
jgi:lysine 2,3-aminomutase